MPGDLCTTLDTISMPSTASGGPRFCTYGVFSKLGFGRGNPSSVFKQLIKMELLCCGPVSGYGAELCYIWRQKSSKNVHGVVVFITASCVACAYVIVKSVDLTPSRTATALVERMLLCFCNLGNRTF